MVKLEDSEEEGEAALWDPGPEAARQRFRHFRYEEAAGPQEALAQLRALCRDWLRPEVHSKEQMLELLVLEQFLGALPPEIKACIRGQQPGSPEEAAALVEGLRRESGGPRRWVSWAPEPGLGLEQYPTLPHPGRWVLCLARCLSLVVWKWSLTNRFCGIVDRVPGPASLSHPFITRSQ